MRGASAQSACTQTKGRKSIGSKMATVQVFRHKNNMGTLNMVGKLLNMIRGCSPLSAL